MPHCHSPVAVSSAFLLLALLCAACTSALIGDVTYADGSLQVPVINSGESTEALVQVTVFSVKDFHQEEQQVIQQPVVLRAGENRVRIPLDLPPGSYKLYVYILKPGERQTATIRDIVVG